MSSFPRHQRRGLIEALMANKQALALSDYFRAIKGAVSLKPDGLKRLDERTLYFRAIKGAVSLKPRRSGPERTTAGRISAPSKARSH